MINRWGQEENYFQTADANPARSGSKGIPVTALDGSLVLSDPVQQYPCSQLDISRKACRKSLPKHHESKYDSAHMQSPSTFAEEGHYFCKIYIR